MKQILISFHIAIEKIYKTIIAELNVRIGDLPMKKIERIEYLPILRFNSAIIVL